jgi:hypothetical protein
MAASQQVVTEIMVDATKATAGIDQYEASLKSATSTTDQFTASQQKQEQATNSAGSSAATAGSQVETSGRSFAAAQRNLNTYLGTLDPIFFATQRLGKEQGNLQSALTTLDRQFATGAVTADQYAGRQSLLQSQLGKVTEAAAGLANGTITAKAALSSISQETEKATGVFNLGSAGAAELEHSVRAVTDAVTAGVSPIRALGQEVPRLAQAFGTSLGAILNPWVIGLAAIAAGFTIVVAHAISTEATVKEFDAALKTFGTDTLATSKGLEQAAEQLREFAIPASTAKAALLDIVRTPGINPAFGEQIVQLAHDLATLEGQGSKTEDETKKITAALAAGVEPTIKWAESFNGLTAAQIADIRQTAELQGSAAALQKAFDDVRAHILPASQSETDFGKATDDLSKSWQGLLDTLAQTGVIQTVVDRLTDILKVVQQTIQVVHAFNNEPQPAGHAADILEAQQAQQLAAQGAIGGASPSLENQTITFGNVGNFFRNLFGGSTPTVTAAPASNLIVGGAISTAALTPIVGDALSSFKGGVLTNNPGLGGQPKGFPQ